MAACKPSTGAQRGHKTGSRTHLVCVCPDRNAEGACQTEVGELELPSSVDEQVLRLQIAMQNAMGVAEGDPPNELVEIGLQKM